MVIHSHSVSRDEGQASQFFEEGYRTHRLEYESYERASSAIAWPAVKVHPARRWSWQDFLAKHRLSDDFGVTGHGLFYKSLAPISFNWCLDRVDFNGALSAIKRLHLLAADTFRSVLIQGGFDANLAKVHLKESYCFVDCQRCFSGETLRDYFGSGEAGYFQIQLCLAADRYTTLPQTFSCQAQLPSGTSTVTGPSSSEDLDTMRITSVVALVGVNATVALHWCFVL